MYFNIFGTKTLLHTVLHQHPKNQKAKKKKKNPKKQDISKFECEIQVSSSYSQKISNKIHVVILRLFWQNLVKGQK